MVLLANDPAALVRARDEIATFLRERLHAALVASEEDVREGRLRSAAEVTADIRRRGS